MTILNNIKEFFNNREIKADLVLSTSVWNYHNSNSFYNLSKNNSSNFCKSVKTLKNGLYVVMTGAKGWSAHSATQLHIFKINNMKIENEIDLTNEFVFKVKKGSIII